MKRLIFMRYYERFLIILIRIIIRLLAYEGINAKYSEVAQNKIESLFISIIAKARRVNNSSLTCDCQVQIQLRTQYCLNCRVL